MTYINSWTRRLFFGIRETVGGLHAITTQTYTELNIKRGNQFYINEKFTGIVATGGTKEILFRMGPEPVILKNRIIKTNAVNLDYEVLVGGTLSFTNDGTPIAGHNANGVSPNTPQSQAFEDPTYTGSGILNERDWIPGSEGVGNRSMGSFSTLGFEKIIPGNIEILVRFTNNGPTDADIFYFLTFYEGPIEPLNDEIVIPSDE